MRVATLQRVRSDCGEVGAIFGHWFLVNWPERAATAECGFDDALFLGLAGRNGGGNGDELAFLLVGGLFFNGEDLVSLR